MRSPWRDRAFPLGLAVAAYAIALLQRPGRGTFDTKVDLHVDPTGFLARVADVWSPTAGLGHVQGGQYSGYLWPMGPFFAALRELGLSPWLVQRLWLGTLLALAAWGTVRLLDRLLSRQRGVAHVVAGLLMVLNPYVVVFTNRTTFTLIGYAALPWLLLLVHRGVRDPRRLWWAAAFALIVTSMGGGVNAAVTAWVLVGPLLLLLYEPLLGGAGWRNAGAFALRAGVATALASVWWVVPALVHAGYGLNFLSYTEQIGAIWATTSLSESLRLMGYWPSYLGVGYGDELHPYFGSSPSLLFDPAVVVASLLVPALAFGGFVWTRRWRYGPFFLALGILGALIMSVGFPEGTPLREGATFAYNHFTAVEFLRTTYKAGPLVALSVACLAGVAAAALARRLPNRTARAAAALAACLVVALAALPMVRGQAVELTYDEVPRAWQDSAAGLDRELPPNTRAVMLPGQPFAFHRWGGTVDPILPSLTDRPVAVRNVPPYDDLHAVDMLWTLDNMVQQERLLPGQLPPLLDLMSAGAVVTATDDDFERSGAMPPAQAARELAAQPGFQRPARSYGPTTTFRGPPETIDPPIALPQVRRYDVPRTRGIVRLVPARAPTLVDGSAAGVAGLAALGGLAPDRPLRYAADASADELRKQAVAGGEVVITDSNRRRVFVATRPRQAYGWTLPAALSFSEDAATLDPFEGHGSDAQTVAVYGGARDVSAPYSPQFPQFPEHRPYAAFDGDPATAWQADPALDEPRHWVEIRFRERRDVPHLDLLPDDSNPNVVVTRVSVNGREFGVRPGWNRVAVALEDVDAVRVAITEQRTEGEAGSAGGFREVRVPGVSVRELLRPPTLAERALRGADLSRTPLTYVFERTTADLPFRRGPVPPSAPVGNRAESEAALARAAQDPEADIRRAFNPPAARRWSADGWATVAPAAPDPTLDAMAGTSAGGRFASSSRFEGRPGFRASRAFDGSAGTAWVGQWLGRGAWIEWRTADQVRLRELRLGRGPALARAPTRVAIRYPGGRTPPLPVGPGGAVVLPEAVRAARFRLEVLEVGPGSAPAVAIGEVRAPGLPRAATARPGAALTAGCGALAADVGGRRLGLAASGTVAALDAGRPLRVRSCGAPLALPAGPTELHARTGLLRPLVLGLRSPAPAPGPAPATERGAVLSAGDAGRGEHTGVRVRVGEPSWLVLGESYSRGWRATCDGRSLGEPAVVDGFANGWRVEPGCRNVAFRFAPQRAVDAGYWIGGAACLALLALILFRRPPRRRGEPEPEPEPEDLPLDDAPRPWPGRAAALAGLVAGGVLGFAFALRAGVVIAPAVALILWRGWTPRTLIVAAAGLLVVVVPALYLIIPGRDRGGYDTRYAVEHVAAHWVTVAAVVLLIVALWQTVSTASRASGGRARAGDPGSAGGLPP